MEKVVFISHSSSNRDLSYEICEELESNGIGCWIAPRDVHGGRPYAEEIVEAIKNCKVVLLIASESINKSDQILNEIGIAVNNAKVILPFKIDSVEFNDSYQYYLNTKHWIMATPNPMDYYNELVSNIKYLLVKKDVDVNTINDQYLISLAEKNRRNLINKTSEKRLSFGLSIKQDDNEDAYHHYESIKRIGNVTLFS